MSSRIRFVVCLVATLMLAAIAAPAASLAAGAPQNDDWVNATLITSIPFSDTVDTSEATTNGDSYNYCGGGSATVWYRVELAADARVEITTAGSGYDTVIDSYQWIDPPGAFAPIACDDNGGPAGTSRLILDLAAGQVYGIMVSSTSGQPGGLLAFAMSAVPPPANDDFDAAVVVAPLPFAQSIDAGTATSALDDPASSCGGQAPSVWYVFTPPSHGRYEITTAGSGYDTLVTVYTGARGELAEVACNDNYAPVGSWQARLRFDADAGVAYHVAVTWGGGMYPRAGFLTFAVALAPAPPANDDFDAATAMTSLPFGEDLDTSEATSASDDPVPSCSWSGPLPSTVWYSITPETTDPIGFTVRGGDFGPTVALYRGTQGNLTELACSSGATTPGFVLDPLPGTTYHLLVGGAAGDAGQLRVDADFAFVVRLTIDGGTVNAKTGIATISGTVTCNKHSYISTNRGELTQKVGRHTVRGPFGTYFECDGTVPWSSEVTGDSGPFVGGKADATLSLFGYASQTGESSQPSLTKTIILKGSRR